MNTRPCRNVYVHVPFCNGKCAYCAFYSEPEVNPASVAQWLDRLEDDAARKSARTLPLDTLYIGGGTPTALSRAALERLFRILEHRFSFLPGAEISIECNPESLTAEKAEILGRHVNRVSMGVQSFRFDFREKIGRRSSGVRAVEMALSLLRANGIENIGFDLIYAIPGETPADWKQELETALSYPIRHLSAYSLSIEEGTELAARGLPPEDSELSFAMWEAAQEILSAHGMPRYEISNYASMPYECRHNQNVWHAEPYLGLGPAACSFDGAVRFTEIPSLSRWLAGEAPEPDVISEEKRLGEMFIMGLRTVRGWKKSEFSRVSRLPWREMWSTIIGKQRKDGLLQETPERIFPTEKGLAFWNDLAEAYL